MNFLTGIITGIVICILFWFFIMWGVRKYFDIIEEIINRKYK